MPDEVRADVAEPGQERERAGRHPRLEEDLDQPERDARRLLGRLEDDAVPRDERGRHHAGRDREREVPRCDDRADATRLVAVDVRLAGALADRYARTEPQRLAPVVLAVVDRLADVGVGLGKRLARLEHLEGCEGAAASVGGRSGTSDTGWGRTAAAGGAMSASSAWPSAKRWRMKDSFEVFSSSRRTR